MADDLRTRIAAALKTANDRVAGFIGYDEMADAVIRELQPQLAAFATDCVTHGDMTPTAKRMLLTILGADDE